MTTDPPRQVLVTSFGYLHSDPPSADLTADVRDHLRDPHIDPALRQLTGHDTAVVEKVLTTPGAEALIDALVASTTALLPAASRTGRLVRIAIGCAGGRHRSVVIADAIASHLARAGWGTETQHRHIHHPVVQRRDEPGPPHPNRPGTRLQTSTMVECDGAYSQRAAALPDGGGRGSGEARPPLLTCGNVARGGGWLGGAA